MGGSADVAPGGRWLCVCWGRPRARFPEAAVPPAAGMHRIYSAQSSFGSGISTAFHKSEEEEALVEKLRRRAIAVAAELGTPNPRGVLTNQRLLRYARFIADPVEECERMLRLRAEVGMDAIHDHVTSGGALPAAGPMAEFWQHNLFGREACDRNGRPVFIAKVGALSNTRALFARVPADQMRLHMFHCLELLNARLTDRSEEQGALLSYTYVLDLQGLRFVQALAEARYFYKRLAEDVNRLAVPYQIARVLLVHAPGIWLPVWEFAKLLLPEKVLGKVHFCARLSDLHEHVEPAQLPRAYGGAVDDDLAFADYQEFVEAPLPPATPSPESPVSYWTWSARLGSRRRAQGPVGSGSSDSSTRTESAPPPPSRSLNRIAGKV